MEYYSAIKTNKDELFTEMWINLESVIQSEVGWKEKYKYHMLTDICGIYKNGTDEPICSVGIEMQT